MEHLIGARYWLAVLAVGAICATPVLAQEKEAKPDRLVRLLPVGEAPPFEQDVLADKRVEREAPPGSIPPRFVVQVGKEGQEKGEKLRLNLDQLSAPMAVGPGTVPLHEVGKNGLEAKPWHNLKVPKKSHSLCVLWRDPNTKSWTKARSITLADDLTSFPAGRVRFVNVSPYSVGITHKGKKLKLAPYKTFMAAQNGAGDLKVHLQSKSGKWHKIFDTQLNQRQGERSNVVIYRADGVKPRMPAKVRLMREPAKVPKLAQVAKD